MTSSPLSDQGSRVDAVDALRLLMADLQSLADRLQLKERSRSLQQTLKATQERVSGPQAAVMLLSEEPALKRRFLERLIGPGLAHVPETSSGVTRLEYGAEAEGVVAMPQGLTAVLPLEQMKSFLGRRGKEMPKQAEQTIRLPNPALARGLMVIDTPPLEAGEAGAALLEAAASADAWVLVLTPESDLNAATRALLRRLPDGAERLEIVIEGAEAMSGDQRASARAALEKTLRDECRIAQPRIVFVSSAATEKSESNFWQGRQATFHSVLLLRGRERWLGSTRALVGEALADVAREIEFELKSASLGLRQARLRLGLKDVDGLRGRFVALGELERDRPKESKPSLVSPVSAFSAEMPTSGAMPATTAGEEPARSPDQTPHDDEMVAEHKEIAPPPGIPSAPMGEPMFVSFHAQDAPVVAKPAGFLARVLARIAPGEKSSDSRTSGDAERITLPWRMAGMTVAALFVCLIVWALWPRMHLPGRQAAAQWDYQPSPQDSAETPPNAPVPEAAGRLAKPDGQLTDPVRAEAAPDAAQAETPDAGAPGSTVSLPASGAASSRSLLSRPTPSVIAARRARRRHNGFLGLGRVWHWIRHPAGGHADTSER